MNRRQFVRGVAAASAASLVWRAPHVAAAAGERVKVGMVGTAHSHAAGKFETLRRLSDLYDVVGVAEPDARRREALGTKKEYAGARWMTEDELLNAPGLQAVLVETDVAQLVPTATRVARAGVHIHLEKPAGDSLPAFVGLVEGMSLKQRALQMGYMFRGHPAFEFIASAVRDGLLGDLYEVGGVMGKVVGPAERKELARFPGGMMFELGCHLLDATVSVLGKPTRVTPHLRKTKPAQDDLADNCLAVLEYDRAVATIRSAAVDVAGGARRQWTVAGDRGTAHWQPLEPAAVLLTLDRATGPYAKGPQEVKLRKLDGRYGDQLARFARVIRGEVALDYPPEREVMGQDVVLRASGMA